MKADTFATTIWPMPKAANLEELNGHMMEASREDACRVISGRDIRVGDAMHLEREHSLPLAREGFQLAGVHFPSVNMHGTVKVLTNFYSAPLPAGLEVQVKVYLASVEI